MLLSLTCQSPIYYRLFCPLNINSFLNSPSVIPPNLDLSSPPDLFLVPIVQILSTCLKNHPPLIAKNQFSRPSFRAWCWSVIYKGEMCADERRFRKELSCGCTTTSSSLAYRTSLPTYLNLLTSALKDTLKGLFLNIKIILESYLIFPRTLLIFLPSN